MAIINPQTFFRFAADHHALLVALYERRDGLTEAELLLIIRRFESEGSPSAHYMVDRLRDLGFIDYAPHATAQYEMTRPFAELMSSPLRDMIDTQKAMDAALDKMERVLEEASACFQVDGAVAPAIDMGQARVRRLRREVVLDFRESIREITPLYEELRRENALARGASHALETIGKNGLTRLGLPGRLGICNWQQLGLFSDSALEAYLLAVQGYVPDRPQPIRAGTTDTAREHVRLDEFDAQVTAALPIPDAWTWLADCYPEGPLNTMLRLYGRLHSGRYGTIDFADEATEYALWGVQLAAHPMTIGHSDHKTNHMTMRTNHA